MQNLIHPQAILVRARMKELGRTQQAIANELGVEQSKISRLLAGKFKKPTPLLERLCRHLQITKPSGAEGLDQEIHEAIREVWDGTREDAVALAEVIRAIGRLRRV